MMWKANGVMPFLQLFVCLLFLVEAELTSTEKDIFNNITPLHYKLILWPDILSTYSHHLAQLYGECNITIRIEKEIEEISLNSSMPITKATLEKTYMIDERGHNHVVATYYPTFLHFSDIEIVTLYFKEKIKRGYYMLTLLFNKNLTNISNKSDGIIRTVTTDIYGLLRSKRWMIAITQVRGSQTFFPCWNSPRIRTTFQISVYHPIDYMALSNTPVRCLDSRNEKTWTHFQSTAPIFPHCINIVVMPISYGHDLDSNVKFWTTDISNLSGSKLEFATDIIQKIGNILKRLKLVDYCKVTQTNYIAIKNFSLGVITTTAFVLYRQEDIIIPNELFSHERIAREPKVAFDIVHQILYQYFLRSEKVLYGYSISMHDMINFLTTYILQQVLPEIKINTSPIRSTYGHISSTLLDFNIDDIIQFIFSSRTILISLCNSNNSHEEELALKNPY